MGIKSAVTTMVDHYEKIIGKQLSMWFLPYKTKMFSQAGTGFSERFLENVDWLMKNGIIPVITYDGSKSFSTGNILDVVIKGEADEEIIDA
jgi:hypothetical protein